MIVEILILKITLYFPNTAIFKMKNSCYILAFLLCNFSVGQAQIRVNAIDSIAEKMNWYALNKSTSSLFVHFDKTIYTNYENVWFTGYLLSTDTNVNARNTLSVALIKNDDRSIWAEDKFVMRYGISSGNMFLPDSIPPGNYSFIVYTNLITNGYPIDLFIQPVTIKTTDAGFTATIKMLDSIKSKSDTARILVNAYTNDLHIISNAHIVYILGDGTNQTQPHKLKTNKSGEAIIPIPLQYVHPNNNVLHVNIKYNRFYKDLNIRLPIYHREPTVKFYPEAGNMVEETAGYIGWEVKNAEGQPLETSGILYKDQQIIDTIQTNTYGMGKFILTPQKGSRYYVKVLYKFSNDTIYNLPVILPKIPIISISKAVVDDTLQFEIKNAQNAGGRLFFLLHNYRDIFLASEINANKSDYSLKIPLTELPKGVSTVTLLDSASRPLAERLFFAHYNLRTAVEIRTDSTLYFTREKIQLSLKLHPPDGKSLQGIASVACVQESRIDIRKMNDIESNIYLFHELQDLPFKHNALGSPEDKTEYLEDVLLIKGWRRYTWTNILLAKVTDTLQEQESLILNGTLLHFDKPVKRPMELYMIVDSGYYTILTDKTGYFEIDPKYIITTPGKKLSLFVNEGNSGFNINIDDPYRKLNESLAKQLIFENNDTPLGSETSESLVLKSDEYAKKLDAVTVISKKKSGYIGWGSPLFKDSYNDCNDYVCLFGILNCANHPHGSPGETKPISGNQYRLLNGEKIVYQDNCNAGIKNYNLTSIKSIKGIYTVKEFYSADYSKFDPPSPEYLSTIYWNPGLALYSDRETKISFYTSDITGNFKVIVQGIIPGDVIFGEYTFTIKKKA
jgi:hypothetical protein